MSDGESGGKGHVAIKWIHNLDIASNKPPPIMRHVCTIVW